MKIEVETSDIKNALSAIEAISKKIPNDNTPGDSPVAILRRSSGFSLISIHDNFSTEIKIPSMRIIGNDDTLIEAWDGNEKNLNDNNVFGLADYLVFKTLCSKLGSDSKTLIISPTDDRRRAKIDAGGGKEYFIEFGPARKIVLSYDKIEAKDKVCSLSAGEFDWMSTTISSLGRIVQPTATRPGFGCVSVSGFPSKSEPLIIAGASDIEGFSFIYEAPFACTKDFTALIPKNLAESFSGFIKSLGNPDGIVDFAVTLDENNTISNTFVSRMAFTSDLFSLCFSCIFDNIPFAAFHMQSQEARVPYCQYKTTKEEIKATVERVSIFAKGEDAVTELSILDGGTVEFVQKHHQSSSDKPARETCSKGDLTNFPDKVPSLGTIVRTSVLKKALSIMPSKKDMMVVVCQQSPEKDARGIPKRLALTSEDGNSELTALMLGIQS